jgi:hypothetical protein
MTDTRNEAAIANALLLGELKTIRVSPFHPVNKYTFDDRDWWWSKDQAAWMFLLHRGYGLDLNNELMKL